MRNKIFYSLCTDDITSIAKQMGVKLTEEEIMSIESKFEIFDWDVVMQTYIHEVLHERRNVQHTRG